MKYRFHWPLTLLLIIGTMLAIRLVWVVTNSTIGWQPHLEQWSEVAADLVGTKTETLSEKYPKDQAEFWLKQVSQVGQASTDAETALGAAWMLDTPQTGFFQRYLKANKKLDSSLYPLSLRLKLDHDAIALSTEEFELLCRDECLDQIETAIRLDNENVEMWRAYALLSFKQELLKLDMKPREDEWESVLDECAKHDPDNALYDYLAAMYLWSSSAEYKWHEGETVLNMKDRATFDLGTKRYHAGLAKPNLNFGTIDYIATLKFLNETSIPFPDQLKAAESRQIGGRISSLLYKILRLQSRQAVIDQKAEKYSEVIASAQNVIRISEQVLNSDGHFYYSPVAQQLRLWSLLILKNLNESHPGLMEAAEARKIVEEHRQLKLESEVLQEVQKQYKAKPKVGNPGIPLWAILIMPTTQSLFLITFCLGLFSTVAVLLSGIQKQQDPSRAKWFMYLIAWIVGLGFTFTLFGLVPAKMISSSVQTGFICGLIWFLFIGFLLGLIYLIRKWFQLSWTQSFALWTVGCLPFVVGFYYSAVIQFIIHIVATRHPMFMILVSFSLVFFCWKLLLILLNFIQSSAISRRRKTIISMVFIFLGFCSVQGTNAVTTIISDQIDVQTWISPAVWRKAEVINITHRDIENIMEAQGSNWVWALIQWHSYFGPLISPFIAMGILLYWQILRRTRSKSSDDLELLRPWKYLNLRQDSKLIAKFCFVSSMIFLLVYLWVYPSIATTMDVKYHEDYENLVNPMKMQNEFTKLTAQVKSDKSLMDQLKASVEETYRRNTEQKKMKK